MPSERSRVRLRLLLGAATVAAALAGGCAADEPAVVEPTPMPTVDLRAPEESTVARARRSAVAVTATGCGQESVGSGVAIAEGVVTNAHVVAGANDVVVITDDGVELAAEVRAFDPIRDLALLRVHDAEGAPSGLAVAEPVGGMEVVALARYDAGESPGLQAIPLEIVRTIRIFISDIYGEGRHERRGLELRGDIGPGDSGAGLIGATGDLVGIVFSSSRRTVDVAYAVSATELASLVDDAADTAVDTGPCLP